MAILAPTAMYAVVTYSNLAVVNPTTGVAAAVDAAGLLSVVDPYAFYRNSPGSSAQAFLAKQSAAVR